METHSPTLCFPDREKSCFACCPPIRPAGYEHIQYRRIIHRELVRAAREFRDRGEGIRPITGYSCWALGYVDPDYRLVGCLLHPLQNQGRDLRYRVDYGGKCARESCREYQIFQLLGAGEKRFYLTLTRGLDSFAYSSRRENPLFQLLWWGQNLLSRIARQHGCRPLDREEFFARYPLLGQGLDPRAHAYMVDRLFVLLKEAVLSQPKVISAYLSLWEEMRRELGPRIPGHGSRPLVHQVGLDPLYQRFLIYGLGIKRITPGEAVSLKRLMEARVERFGRRFKDRS